MQKSRREKKPRIALALGSGSARGWSHIGVIQELSSLGIKPDIISGTSIGALVGAAYVSQHLDSLENWVCALSKTEIIKYLDLKLLTGGGFVEGNKLFEFLQSKLGDRDIESLDTAYGAVSCNLATGQEIWFREGSLLEAVRASIALPGLFTPVRHEDNWLIDGGLVNPVPVSLSRAMGADFVIAVNLNGDILGKHLRETPFIETESIDVRAERNLLEKLADEVKQRTSSMVNQLFDEKDDGPGLFDVIASSINIMQDRITRSRMAGDPPDILLAPRLANIGLMEFDRAGEAIEEGRKAVRRAKPALEDMLQI